MTTKNNTPAQKLARKLTPNPKGNMNAETVIENPIRDAHDAQPAEEAYNDATFEIHSQHRLKAERVEDVARAHLEKLAGTYWRFYANEDLVIEANKDYLSQPVKDARAIARRFPGLVWKKVKNQWQCGVIDYVSELDGVTIRIENAETIQFKDGGLVSL